MTREAVNAARAPRPEDRALLAQRAVALARDPGAGVVVDAFPAITFSLGREHYALDARIVRQVSVLRALTPLPGARLPVYGVTHWRGSVLTVLDLRAALGATTHGLPDLSRIVVVETAGRTFGILVDFSLALVEVDRSAIRELPADDRGGRTLLLGIMDDGLLVIDAEAFRVEFGTGMVNTSVTPQGG